MSKYICEGCHKKVDDDGPYPVNNEYVCQECWDWWVSGSEYANDMRNDR